MAGYNRIVMVGNLTRDPEFKNLPSGQAVCRLGLATNRSFKNRQTGMQMQEVCYIDIDVWGAQAESCQKYLAKGRSVLVEGRLKLDTWQDQQGANRNKHSIVADRVVFLSTTGSDEAGMDNQYDAPISATSTVDSSVKTTATPAEPAQAERSFGTENTAEFAKIEQEIAEKQNKKTAVKKTKTKDDTSIEGLSEFKDEPPFEDELPF